MENLLKDMGKRIFDRRKQLNMTQETLAELAHVTPQTISPQNWVKRLCGLRRSSKSVMHFTSAPSICCEASSQKQIPPFLWRRFPH